jgi:hypothetical protein
MTRRGVEWVSDRWGDWGGGCRPGSRGGGAGGGYGVTWLDLGAGPVLGSGSCGISGVTSVGLHLPMKVLCSSDGHPLSRGKIFVLSTALPQADGSYVFFHRLALVDRNYDYLVSFWKSQ